MTSGGDAAGMNPAIRAAVDHARQLGMNPYVVYDGLEGLIDGKIKEATRELTSDMIYRGGTLLRSSRSKRFFDYEFRKQAYEHLKDRNIDKLVIMGGDGSFRALNDFFNDFEVPFAGIPATIDNDIAGTDYCLGVDTAQNVILDCIDSVRDTARSHHRAFVIETMGRDCGYLAMTTALCSAADICIVPEIPYDLESIYKRLQPVINEEGELHHRRGGGRHPRGAVPDPLADGTRRHGHPPDRAGPCAARRLSHRPRPPDGHPLCHPRRGSPEQRGHQPDHGVP